MTTTQRPNDDLEAQLVENWDREDPDLTPVEKETTFRFSKDDDLVHIHTDETGIGRRLIQHPDSILDQVTTLADGVRQHLDPQDVSDEHEIIGLRCRLPIGALSVRSSPRKATGHSHVVASRVLRETNHE